LAELGYLYLNIDDCWSIAKQNSEGQLVSDPKTFPFGIKALADYVHTKGLILEFILMLGFLHVKCNHDSFFMKIMMQNSLLLGV
jgi:alpha-galactosidase